MSPASLGREIAAFWTPGAAGSPAEEPLPCSRFVVAVGHNAVGRWETERVGMEWPKYGPCASSTLGWVAVR